MSLFPTKFNCIFCNHDMGSGNTYFGFHKMYYCNNCPLQVNHVVDQENSPNGVPGKLVMIGLLVNQYSFPRYLINIHLIDKTLEMLEVKQAQAYLDDEFPTEPMFKMDNPPPLNPQNAKDFVKRILNQKVFL